MDGKWLLSWVAIYEVCGNNRFRNLSHCAQSVFQWYCSNYFYRAYHPVIAFLSYPCNGKSSGGALSVVAMVGVWNHPTPRDETYPCLCSPLNPFPALFFLYPVAGSFELDLVNSFAQLLLLLLVKLNVTRIHFHSIPDTRFHWHWSTEATTVLYLLPHRTTFQCKRTRVLSSAHNIPFRQECYSLNIIIIYR